MAALLPRRTLGRTGLSVSVLGFGASPLGGVFEAVDEVRACISQHGGAGRGAVDASAARHRTRVWRPCTKLCGKASTFLTARRACRRRCCLPACPDLVGTAFMATRERSVFLAPRSRTSRATRCVLRLAQAMSCSDSHAASFSSSCRPKWGATVPPTSTLARPV